jgi:hypothetical protein
MKGYIEVRSVLKLDIGLPQLSSSKRLMSQETSRKSLNADRMTSGFLFWQKSNLGLILG